MNTGSSQTGPASNMVLIASLTYTLVAYAIISGLWGVVIAPQLLLIVVGVQLAMLLLGGSRVLTGLGAAFLAALLAVASLFAAVFLIFPPSIIYKAAALASGTVTIFFILFSFITASRGHSSVLAEQVETVDGGVLFEDESEEQGAGRRAQGAEVQAAEEQGVEVREEPEDAGTLGEHEDLFADEGSDGLTAETTTSEDLFADVDPLPEDPVQEEPIEEGPSELLEQPVTEYEFDDLSDEKLEISLAGDAEDLFPDDTKSSKSLPFETVSSESAPEPLLPEPFPVEAPIDTANANFDIPSLDLTDMEEAKPSPEASPEISPEPFITQEDAETTVPDEGDVADPTDLDIPEEWVEGLTKDISGTQAQAQPVAAAETEIGTEPASELSVTPPDDLDVALNGILQPEEAPEEPMPVTSAVQPGPGITRPDTAEVEVGSGSVYQKEYKMRTHYRVLDADTGELYGVYYGDEGYASLDLVTLGALLGEKIGSPEISIVKLDWSNFDEIEVHIEKAPGSGQQVAELPVAAISEEPAMSSPEQAYPWEDQPDEVAQARSTVEAQGTEQPTPAAFSEELEATSPVQSYPWEEAPQVIQAHTLEKNLAGGLQAPRYVIYDRRTIQPMMEYVPEGDRPRIDRLTLYKLFPEYDFKTFEIDSIRWHEDEVRIFIRGEKKDRKKALRQGSGQGKGEGGKG